MATRRLIVRRGANSQSIEGSVLRTKVQWMRRHCHTCGKSYKIRFVPHVSGEMPGICRLCGGSIYEGFRVEELLERHHHRQKIRLAAKQAASGARALDWAELAYAVVVALILISIITSGLILVFR
jgi:hypothetical protein